jgi:hypothetical protein|tara:strand:+ start:116 stop:796 length:681 start_codon:yes stop_codon:yes gene_type:complete
MAVSIDNVYQKVLAIANKEQRGYLTPQEFNLFADQVQMEIFEQYFYDINQFNRAPGNNTEYADMLNLLEEKIAIFKNIKLLYYQSPYYQKPRELYRLGTLETGYGEIEQITHKEYLKIKLSPLAKPTLKRSVFIDMPRGYRVYPTFTKNVHCHYIRRPAEAKWGYNIIGGNALYDATISEDFQLHASEEQNLITKILALTGITLNKPGLVQIAENSDAKNIQLKKA